LSIPLGVNIKKLRLATGMTQRQLAYQLRISVQAVSKWERGLTYPDVTLLLPIAELFGVTLDELFGRHEAAGTDTSRSTRFHTS
jgi:transcriptional regulator with XRE-family HTH domain